MPSEKAPFYDPIPPTYDEALASGSRYHADDWGPRDERDAPEEESQSLLRNPNANQGGSSRRADGYRPPTVETDDEVSLWGSDDEASADDDDEAAQVRREMQEMDIEEPNQPRSSIWGKRIGFLSLPRWKWSWRPSLPRLRIQLPSLSSEPLRTSDDTGDAAAEDSDETAATQPRNRFCTGWPKIERGVAILAFVRAFALLTIVGLIYLLFASDMFNGSWSQVNSGARFNPEEVKAFIQDTIDIKRMRDSVNHFSSYAHIAGTEGDYGTAMDVQRMFTRAGLDEVLVDEYIAYLNYPRKDGRAVQIMDEKDPDKAKWSAALEENEVGGETAGHQTYVFHGHSKSGDVKGPLIYANYGSRADFKHLKDKGIEVKGAIALVRYGGTQTDRALKVKAAELAGFAGCIIYSDPADDGFEKGKVAPDGPWMPEDGVQRGSVSLMSWVVGDVLTPGWESKEGKPRMKVNESPGLVQIPSLPLAWRDAKVLLGHLSGHGQKVPKEWVGSTRDVPDWWTGDANSPIVRLQNEQDEVEKQPIWNVYGKIEGMEQSAKSIIIGNHRDAWAFGATDPHSGTAIMIEIAQVFGNLIQHGWRPLRTIEFMSWDAEEYNLIGSTEYVENNIDELRENAYAYINLDTAVSGSKFRAAGSPVFQKSLHHALKRVYDPFNNATLEDLWQSQSSTLEGLGAGSDYVAFQDIAGTSSLDLSFEGPFPYHSSYDNSQLMEKAIDPEYIYHLLLAQVVGLVLRELSDDPILSFDMSAYGKQLEKWVDDLEKWAIDTAGIPRDAQAKPKKGSKLGKDSISFKQMRSAAKLITSKARDFDRWGDKWKETTGAEQWESNERRIARVGYNNKQAAFETALLDIEFGGGIPNRTQFKHVVFGPQLWSGYDEAFFPAIRDTIEAGDWEAAHKIIAKTAAIMRNAASHLKM